MIQQQWLLLKLKFVLGDYMTPVIHWGIFGEGGKKILGGLFLLGVGMTNLLATQILPPLIRQSPGKLQKIECFVNEKFVW